MKQSRPLPLLACCLVLAIGVIGAGAQIRQLVRRLAAWERQEAAVPAFGQAQIIYFGEPTCPACQAASPTIGALERRYPRCRIARVDTTSPAGIALQEEYSVAYRVPDRDRGRIPVAFAAKRYFIGADAITTDLPAYLTRGSWLLAHTAGRSWPRMNADRRGLEPDLVASSAPIRVHQRRPLPRFPSPTRSQEPGATRITARFRSLDVVAVLIAGAVDSINPCAIATLIFLLSFLTTGAGCPPRAGRRRGDLLWIGGLFTLGVYLTYFLIGLGLLRALHALSAIPLLARCLYPAAALMTFALALLSFRDCGHARRGETTRVLLQLPRALKLQVHRVIRTRLRRRHLALAAFGTAVLVSALEFTCTSQVYLPTLMYMAQAGSERPRAIALLLLYNLMFVLPLIAIFTAAHAGVRTRALAGVASRHATTAKLAMGLLFLGFTFYLAAVGVRLWSLA